MPLFNKIIGLASRTAPQPLSKSQTWPAHSTNDNELVRGLKCPLSTYLFHPASRFHFPHFLSKTNYFMRYVPRLLLFWQYFTGYMYFHLLSWETQQSGITHWGWYLSSSPWKTQGPREFGLPMSFLDTQHVWSFRFKAKLGVHYSLRSC